jgi:ABC-type transport system substrate-binding protein
LIDAAGRAVDQAEASALYARIDSLVYDQAPWIYLYFPKTFYAVSGGLSGYKLPSLYLGNDFTTVSKKRN